VKVAEANVDLAKLDLHHTEVRAPFAGRIGRRMVDPGNLVKEDETVLATLVAEKPMYVYFDVDARTMMSQLRRGDSDGLDRLIVGIGMAGDEGFPYEGITNFRDNRVDPNTGSMWMRAEFTGSHGRIEAGIFARVRVPLGDTYVAMLIPEQAIGTDQGRKFVFVVRPDNKVEYRPIQVGQLHGDLRVVVSGLAVDEKFVVSGLQRIRSGAEVTAKEVEVASVSLTARTAHEAVSTASRETASRETASRETASRETGEKAGTRFNGHAAETKPANSGSSGASP
jgi:RND family efflux transporter MFP subunit